MLLYFGFFLKNEQMLKNWEFLLMNWLLCNCATRLLKSLLTEQLKSFSKWDLSMFVYSTNQKRSSQLTAMLFLLC